MCSPLLFFDTNSNNNHCPRHEAKLQQTSQILLYIETHTNAMRANRIHCPTHHAYLPKHFCDTDRPRSVQNDGLLGHLCIYYLCSYAFLTAEHPQLHLHSHTVYGLFTSTSITAVSRNLILASSVSAISCIGRSEHKNCLNYIIMLEKLVHLCPRRR